MLNRILSLLTILSALSFVSPSNANAARIYASPNPCQIGSNGLCTTWISVSGGSSAPALAVTVWEEKENREKLMSCYDQNGGQAQAPWIGVSRYIFRLYEAQHCGTDGIYNARLIDQVTVFGQQGNPPPPPGERMSIGLNIDDTVDLFIQGSRISYQVVQGAPGVYLNGVSGYLPYQPMNIQASASGTFGTSIQILEQPSQWNNYTLKVRVYEKSPGRNNIQIKLYY